MENRTLSESFTELSEVVQKYVDARMRYWRLILLEKSTRATTFLFSSLVVLVLMLSGIMFLGFAFSFWYAENYGSLWTGFLISAGLSVLLLLIVFFLRKWIFSRNIIRNLRKLILSEEEEKLK